MSLLPGLTYSAPGVPLYGSGGGGGGGANPQVSTLTFAPNGVVNMTTSLVFNSQNTGSFTDFTMDSGISANAIVTGFSPGGLANVQALSPPSGGNGVGINVASTDAGGAVIAAANGNGNPSTLSIIADRVIMPYDLAVSSINGATPGGGGSVPADLNLSTLTVAGATILRGGLNMSNTSISLASDGHSGLYWNAGDNNTYITGTSTAQVVIGTEAAPGQLQIGDTSINVATALYATSQAVNFSTLNVSTINGAAYPPPPAGGLTKTVVPTLASVNLLGNGSYTPVTGTFTTLANHMYSMIGFVYAVPSPNISSNASLQWTLGNIDRAYNGAVPLWGYSAAGGSAFGNQIAINLTWVASGAVTQAIYGQMVDGLGTAVSTFTNSSADLLLIDYGVVS